MKRVGAPSENDQQDIGTYMANKISKLQQQYARTNVSASPTESPVLNVERTFFCVVPATLTMLLLSPGTDSTKRRRL